MGKQLRDIPQIVAGSEAHSVLQDLANTYEKYINEPIIREDKYDALAGESLTYPKRSEIFIPQPFKALRFQKGMSLEQNRTWHGVETRRDLAAFLLSCLNSPVTDSKPIIILGHPGSGKSLLTSVLAARLGCELFTPLRVELRSVSADHDIADQINEQIYADTKREMHWPNVSGECIDRPPLVILDGYDELLQASGKVFSNYLLKVETFQETELTLRKRPVKTIVTSRITLIDKASIPADATVIRLMEFEDGERSEWIKTWNDANRTYFMDRGLAEFAVPASDRIKQLSEQPLLLLMLAIYDSEKNDLRQSENLDQTLLYDELLSRFIRREGMKEREFAELPEEDKSSRVRKDMRRLGVAAMGMFNRNTLSVRIGQLNSDLVFFKDPQRDTSKTGASLSNADLLVGSFFFVQESKAIEQVSQAATVDTAFEFLHNTFGEFLTADFLISVLIHEASLLLLASNDDRLRMTYEDRWAASSTAETSWFACLMHSPLFSRPVIMEMMREWLPHRLARNQCSRDDFDRELDWIVNQQIRIVLDSPSLPTQLSASASQPFGPKPLTACLSIYTINLVVLRSVLSDDGYANDLTYRAIGGDGVSDWDRLTQLWRSWFSYGTLNGLGTIVFSERSDDVVTMKGKQEFESDASFSRLDLLANLGSLLADVNLEALAGLSHLDALRCDFDDLAHLTNVCELAELDVERELLIRWLRFASSKHNKDRLNEVAPYFEIPERGLRFRGIRIRAETSVTLLYEWIFGLNNRDYSRVFGDEEYRKFTDMWTTAMSNDISWSLPPGQGVNATMEVLDARLATPLVTLAVLLVGSATGSLGDSSLGYATERVLSELSMFSEINVSKHDLDLFNAAIAVLEPTPLTARFQSLVSRMNPN